jgi:hypothetical protein
MTAGQLALLAGYSGLLFGPGNSQPHKVLVCGGRMVDVHALKAHSSACSAVALTGGPLVRVHGRGHVGVGAATHGRSSIAAGLQAGLKPSSTTGFNTVAAATSNQTKVYGNGMTAGQIAVQAGFGSAMLFGPGNSQPHKVLCGARTVDVHALKAHAGACAGTASAVSPTAAAGVNAQTSAAVTAAKKSGAAAAKGRGGGVLGATATRSGRPSSMAGAALRTTVRSGRLPFTGLALGLLLGLGLMLLISGLGMRRAARPES